MNPVIGKPEAFKVSYSTQELLDALHGNDILFQLHGQVPMELHGVSADSRSITTGALFIARRGITSDGHDHISQALLQGASMVLAEQMVPQLKLAPCYAIVSNTAKAYGLASSLHFGRPEQSLVFIGLTGTNGKTSTSLLLADLLEQHLVSTMVIGTTGIYLKGVKVHSSTHTTPDAMAFYDYLAQGRQAGVTHVIMEASSHGLAQERFFPAKFSYGVFTSFSQDHLDYHQSMEEYFQAKLKLFSADCSTPEAKFVVHFSLLAKVLANDPSLKGRLRGYGFVDQHPEGKAGWEPAATNFSITKDANRSSETFTTCDIGSDSAILHSYKMPFRAEFLLENTLAAILSFLDIKGIWPDPKTIQGLKQIPGRMQKVHAQGLGPMVYVDYAHSPDALRRVLQDLNRTKVEGRLLLVFGCGGDRDRTKRPLMGAIAAEFADDIFITSDNPRSEKPEAIIEEISRGIAARHKVHLITNRKEAIQAAINEASPQDTVLIAGKGHETGQIIGSIVLPFDDAEVAASVLWESIRNRKPKTEDDQ